MRYSTSHLSGEPKKSVWLRAIVLLVLVWVTVAGAAEIGSRLGVHFYVTRSATPAPSTEQQIRALDRASSAAADMARRDLQVWQTSFNAGSTVARIQGATAAGMLVLAAWATAGLRWLWVRRRMGI